MEEQTFAQAVYVGHDGLHGGDRKCRRAQYEGASTSKNPARGGVTELETRLELEFRWCATFL